MTGGGEEALRREYVIGDEIGRGRFGTVRRCHAAATAAPFAHKSTPKALLRALEVDKLDLARAVGVRWPPAAPAGGRVRRGADGRCAGGTHFTFSLVLSFFSHSPSPSSLSSDPARAGVERRMRRRA